MDREDVVRPEVFIGKLPQGTDQATLEGLCARFQPTQVRLHSKGGGCAFASFPSFAQAEAAIKELNGSTLPSSGLTGEPLVVQLADFKGAKGAEKIPKVFVGGINSYVNEASLLEACQYFGQVVTAKIHRKGDGPPCAFVTFSTFSEAERCILEMNGRPHEVMSEDGKEINVKWAHIRSAAPAPGPPRDGGLGRSAPRGNSSAIVGHGAPQAASWAWAQQAEQAQVSPHGGYGGGGGGAPQPQGSKVFIGGLKPEVLGHITEDFIRGMMAPFGDIVEAKLLHKDGKDPCGFVKFSHAAQAQAAVSALGGLGRIVVRWAEDGRPPKRSHDEAFFQNPAAIEYSPNPEWAYPQQLPIPQYGGGY